MTASGLAIKDTDAVRERGWSSKCLDSGSEDVICVKVESGHSGVSISTLPIWDNDTLNDSRKKHEA